MDRVRDVSVGEIVDRLSRYRPLVILLVGILAAGSVSFTRSAPEDPPTLGGPAPGLRTPAGTNDDGGTEESVSAPAGGSASSAATSATGGRRSAGATSGAATGTARAPVPRPGAEALAGPDCDTVAGRLKFPSKYAPPCVAPWPKGADNGGATHGGVSRDAITVAIRQCPVNPATNAALAAAGIDDTPEDQRRMHAGYLDLYNSHYATYGRTVRIVYFESSCAGTEQGHADALRVVSEIKAFAVFNAGGSFADELAARGVMNITWVSTVEKNHLKRAPHEWAVYMTPEQQFTHVAEYIGKRIWNKNAKWAGDATFQQRKRTFGLLYPDNASGEVAASVQHFGRELATYGARLHTTVAYAPGTSEAQEQARIAIAKLKDADVTSVVVYTDPIATIFFTQEATRQAYFPEWVLTGALLQDGNIFGRTFDQVQWAHAFGPSALSSRHSEELYEGYAPYAWHHGEAPPGRSAWHGFQPVIDLFFLGIHLAGPKLSPQTFRDGLWYRFPPTGGAAEGQVIILQWSFGDHGYWRGVPDYSGGDDTKEIWWDPDATGKDEIGQEGKGMYREVDFGKRHVAGGWPSTEPRVFDPTNTSTYYDTYPPADDPGKPPHVHHKWEYTPLSSPP